MIAILSLIVVLVVSMVIVRVATVALTLTGVSSEMARFQARSAFTGAGFTTGESERMVSHPVRRRIIMLLMLLGNAGIVTAVSTLILSFTGAGSSDDGSLFDTLAGRIGLLAVALFALIAISHSRLVDRWMSRAIRWALARWTRLEIRDYRSLLRLTDAYVVTEMVVREEDWVEGRTLIELSLAQEGVLVLGIERPDGHFLGAPRGTSRLRAGDLLLLYGHAESIEDLDERPKGPEGNRRHVEAVGNYRDRERAAWDLEREVDQGDGDG